MSKMFDWLQKRIVADINVVIKSFNLNYPPVNNYKLAVNALRKIAKDHGLSNNKFRSRISKIAIDNPGLQIRENIHFILTDDGPIINETLWRQIQMYTDPERSAFEDNQNYNKKIWAYLAAKEGVTLEKTAPNGTSNKVLMNFGKGTPKYEENWVDSNTG
ncbi:MAG: hypothetical protein Nk1A_8040 [Endomicrobiia bacterium]|nr:MAG: hypothetical protein Nk1A_8040 [Endomicrobiia bacterium]